MYCNCDYNFLFQYTMRTFIHWIVATLAIIITAYLLPGTKIDSFFAAMVTALVLGLINAVIRPLFIILTLPINILSLGLFTFIINAALVMLTATVVPGFHVKNFWWALLFSMVLSIINYILSQIEKDQNVI